MKKHFSKILWGFVMVMTLTSTLAFSSMMKTSKENSQPVKTQSSIATANPVSISYTYYYRTHNGWLQKRKYNRTFGCWAESSWHNVKYVGK